MRTPSPVPGQPRRSTSWTAPGHRAHPVHVSSSRRPHPSRLAVTDPCRSEVSPRATSGIGCARVTEERVVNVTCPSTASRVVRWTGEPKPTGLNRRSGRSTCARSRCGCSCGRSRVGHRRSMSGLASVGGARGGEADARYDATGEHGDVAPHLRAAHRRAVAGSGRVRRGADGRCDRLRVGAGRDPGTDVPRRGTDTDDHTVARVGVRPSPADRL